MKEAIEPKTQYARSFMSKFMNNKEFILTVHNFHQFEKVEFNKFV